MLIIVFIQATIVRIQTIILLPLPKKSTKNKSKQTLDYKQSSKGFTPKPSPSGSGGLFGGKPKAPKTVNDTGHSGSYADILGVVSEGEIEDISRIYIDETPILNYDSDFSKNFQGLTYETRTGTQNQDRVSGDSSVESETSITQEVKNLLPITKQIINKNLDAIRVRLGFVLQEFPPKGGVLGSSVSFTIDVKEGSGAFVTRVTDTISGRYSQLTEFEYELPVNNLNSTVNTFLVRVTRTTPQDTDLTRYQRQLNFQSYTEIIETKLNYPNSALVKIHIDATQFSSSPNFSFKVYGRKIQIPSNATVAPDRGLNYNGVWDGTFITPAYACTDPAWILYDLLTNTRYGLGRYIKAANINRYALYEISQYCNALVSDGLGGTERRYACNVVLNGTEDAYKVIESIRSIFRGFSYFVNGAINFAADMPGATVMQFTQADVEDGMFSYARTSLKSRHTVALVTYIDPADFWKRAIEVVEDPDGIALYGVRTLEITAYGCTSRGQARRAGLSALYTERLEIETVTFKVRAYGAACTPGMIIKVADARRADIRYGGLIADYQSNYIIFLDSPVTFLPGQTYTLCCMLTDGTIEERTVNLSTSTSTEIHVTLGFSTTPLIEGNWILSTVTVTPQLFRVLNRSTVAGSEDSMYEITALEYRPDKYDAIENGLALAPRLTRITAPLVVNVPRSINVNFQIIQSNGRNIYVLTANWLYPLNSSGQRDEFISSYLVEYRRGTGDWLGTVSTTNLFQEFEGLPSDVYYCRVAAVDINGNSSLWIESGSINVGALTTDLSYASANSSMFIVEY